MSSATVTPSLVTVGLPQPLSRTALRPRGPRVLRTARASLLTPASSFCRASSLYVSCFAPIQASPFAKRRYVRDSVSFDHGRTTAQPSILHPLPRQVRDSLRCDGNG